MNKIAVFICGPKRYASLVKKNLSIILDGFDYDNFYFIWDDDLSDMKRDSEFFDLQDLNEDPKTKVLLMHKPYSKAIIEEIYGDSVLGHSNKNAMIGMFYSISTLCALFRQLPDVKSYSHILRIRSDCLLFNNGWLKNYNNEADIVVSDNPLIPSLWTSDHIFFGPADKFLKVWSYNSSEEINKKFVYNVNNPELMLSKQIGLLMSLNKKKQIKRYLDYHIIYTTLRKGEPEYIGEYSADLRSLFILKEIPSEQIRCEHFNKLNKIKADRERNIFIYLSKTVFGEKIKRYIRNSIKCFR